MEKKISSDQFFAVVRAIKPKYQELPVYVKDLHFDEIDAIELIVRCEEEFDVLIDDEYWNACKTCDELVQHLDSLMNAEKIL